MSKKILNTRKILADIILGKTWYFTAEEVAREFRTQTGSTTVDGRLNVHGFLKRLAELGLLERYGNQYRILEVTIAQIIVIE